MQYTQYDIPDIGNQVKLRGINAARIRTFQTYIAGNPIARKFIIKFYTFLSRWASNPVIYGLQVGKISAVDQHTQWIYLLYGFDGQNTLHYLYVTCSNSWGKVTTVCPIIEGQDLRLYWKSDFDKYYRLFYCKPSMDYPIEAVESDMTIYKTWIQSFDTNPVGTELTGYMDEFGEEFIEDSANFANKIPLEKALEQKAEENKKKQEKLLEEIKQEQEEKDEEFSQELSLLDSTMSSIRSYLENELETMKKNWVDAKTPGETKKLKKEKYQAEQRANNAEAELSKKEKTIQQLKSDIESQAKRSIEDKEKIETLEKQQDVIKKEKEEAITCIDELKAKIKKLEDELQSKEKETTDVAKGMLTSLIFLETTGLADYYLAITRKALTTKPTVKVQCYRADKEWFNVANGAEATRVRQNAVARFKEEIEKPGLYNELEMSGIEIFIGKYDKQ